MADRRCYIPNTKSFDFEIPDGFDLTHLRVPQTKYPFVLEQPA